MRFAEWQPCWQTSQALAFLQKQVDDQPWLLQLNYAIPHDPYFMPQAYATLFDSQSLSFPPNVKNERTFREELAGYYGLTAWLDTEMGQVLDALHTRRGRRRTIVIFTSDHGWNLGSHGLPAKFSLFEESACVPFIIADPKGPKETCCELPVSLIDLMPTLVEMGGGSVLTEVEGSSLLPLLSGKAWDRKTVYLQVIEHPKHCYERWDPPSRGVRSSRYKYIEQQGNRRLLFDIKADPYEMRNLIDDSEYVDVVNELAAELKTWVIRTRDPWPESAMQGAYYNVKDNPFGEFQAHIGTI